MKKLLFVAGCFLPLAALQAAPADRGDQTTGADPAKLEHFETSVRPLLANKCYACHTESKLGGLRLDSRATILRGGSSGPAVRPGNPKGSILIQAVTHTHDRLKMPPTGGKLSEKEIAALRAWVRDGAVWPDEDIQPAATESSKYTITPEQRAFWSFQRVSKPALPKVADAAWARTATDRFILAKLEDSGLEPAPPADKRSLIRRATLDLTGLPPAPEHVEAFVADDAPDAFEKVVDRLLASPRYGERWGRYWLDLARYSDGKIGTRVDQPYPNAFRYRDWVIQAFNDDLPYDEFVRAQLAADLLEPAERRRHLPALGFLAFTPRGDDRVDVTTRTFLGLTVGCAQCHDHKYDPIPTKDFYSLQGVFTSSVYHEYPLAPDDEVKAYQDAQKAITAKKAAIKKFIDEQSKQIREIFFHQRAEYFVAAWKVISKTERDVAAPGVAAAAVRAGLEPEVLERCIQYIIGGKEHQYLDEWDAMIARGGSLEEAQTLAAKVQQIVVDIDREKKEIEDRNYVKLGGAKGVADEKTRQYTNLEFLDLKKWYFWRDLASEPHTRSGFKFDGGVFYYGSKEGMEIDRFLSGAWRQHLGRLRGELKELEAASPEPFPFIHGYKDADKIADLQVHIRGEKDNLGELAPRRFLHILSDGQPERFEQGSGRLELANRMVAPGNPLTARVMVNRVWRNHFGRGFVETPGNFGRLGERPTHPKLLDYLAAEFVAGGWSVKALHREIMLSSVYRLSVAHIAANFDKDPANKLLWRFHLQQRLDAESMRDSILAVAGSLDESVGGPPKPFTDDNVRRGVYGTVSRTQTDRTMTLFDFPDPNATSQRRAVTVGPMLRLYFMNSSFIIGQSKALARRLATDAGDDDRARIRRAYALLYARPPTESEIKMGLEFVRTNADPWPKYAQALLASSEFSSVN